MHKKFSKIKMMLAIPMSLLIISLFSIPALAANPSQVIDHVNTTSKVIALTFDDCSNRGTWSSILDILEQDNVKATFFPYGVGATGNEDLLKRTSDLGFQIGNHSYSHPYFTTLTSAQITDELTKCDDFVKGITGQSTKPYFRPPNGDYNAAVLQALGDDGYSKTILWTVDTQDYDGVSADQIKQTALDQASPGGIIIMHANFGAVNTPAALPGIISGLKADGYKFVTIEELLTYAEKTTPTITTLPTASAINYGQALSASTLSGGVASVNGTTVAGTFAFTTPTTTPNAGTYTADVTFTPNDSTNYNAITGTVSLTVNANTLITNIVLAGANGSTNIALNETLQMNAAISPSNATNKSITWKSSNNNATVDTAGKVTAVSAGNVTITAKANDGSGVQGSIWITVIN